MIAIKFSFLWAVVTGDFRKQTRPSVAALRRHFAYTPLFKTVPSNMPGPGWLTGKSFVSVNDIGKDKVFTNLGGRVDLRKEINEIKFTASITDASARDYEAAPWLKDSIVTAEKRLNGEFYRYFG